MKREKSVTSKAEELPGRLTRARAATSGKLPTLKRVAQEAQKKSLGSNPERDNTCPPQKKRAVLQDVTNICRQNTSRSVSNATKIQAKKGKLAKASQRTASKVAPSNTVLRLEAGRCSVNLEGNALLQRRANQCGEDDGHSQTSRISGQLLISQKKAVKVVAATKASTLELLNTSKDPDVTDIDADFEDPQLCSLYSSDIYDNLRVAELSRRPYPHFMETVQREINQSMRGILVDWLVEVSEEYRLQSDTLYHTVYLIDLFLSKNYAETPRLQLLGITCMLVASKYEEIQARGIEDFCLMTDNTYKKEDVVKMEIEVLKSSDYQLFAPTTKTFLRRFLRAAQASYENPSYELEYLANYLAELTLMDYGFLNFLPSMIAASTVFLARWTLDQSIHPWNATLQHYASYKASELKTTVLALQHLQLNSKGCPLTAIRTKYRDDKFKCVAALSSPKLPETLF